VSGGVALVAGALAIAANAMSLWPLNEYSKETMRGGRSELTDLENKENKTKGGLNKDYAFEYSYGIAESFTAIVPNFYGGGSSANHFKGSDSKFAEKLGEVGFPEEQGIQYANGYAYWGDQPIQSGTVYFGAVICFLFILSLFFVRGWVMWGILSISIFGFILAWGNNLAAVNYFLFDYLPLYNKFRAPSVALVIPQLGFVLLGCMALQNVLYGTLTKEEVWKKFKTSAYVTGGVFVLLAIMYFTFDYTSKNDAQLRQGLSSMLMQSPQGQQANPQMQQQADETSRSIISGLKEDRQSLYGKDLMRSLLLVLVAAGSIWLYLRNKLKLEWALTVVILLSCFDLLAVGKRYLNNNNFIEEADFESVFVPNAADMKIKADPDPYFRVFDQTASNPFADSRASYHHHSIGGYNAARLALYEDIIQRQLRTGNMNVYNMLNTKYFIVGDQATRQPDARLNADANGPAWFVKAFSFAKNADDEMSKLSSLNTKDSAVIDQRYQKLAGAQPAYDSSAKIQFIQNLNDKISYRTNASSNQFAVFSEVYYPDGWNAYIDGKKMDYLRVNYVLRGMPVPAGNHTIEFRFEPRSVILGDKITLVSCILIFILIPIAIFLEVRRKRITATRTGTVAADTDLI
jgi:hypothetical protein